MLEKFNILRNVGQFDSVTPGSSISFTSLTMLYAENGRGKTTLAAILRSLSTLDGEIISERKRLGAANDPHIVCTIDGSQAMFKNGTWTGANADIAIFDDIFVAENVCSGIELQSSHRQKLHELILGSQGVALNKALQDKVDEVEAHNVSLKAKAEAIPAIARGPFDVKSFCKLSSDPAIDAKILEAERRLAAAKAADSIRNRSDFSAISLPDFDLDAIKTVLGQTLSKLEAAAAIRVRDHLKKLGSGGEQWVSDGMTRVPPVGENGKEECPFCAQELDSSNVIEHYKVYFSEEYEELKKSIRHLGISIRDAHSESISAAFEREIRKLYDSSDFWKNFTEMPELNIDTAAIFREWTTARDAVLQQLRDKAGSPLDEMSLSQSCIDAVIIYRKRIQELESISNTYIKINEDLAIIREQAGADDSAALKTDLDKLRAQKARFDPRVDAYCSEYINEQNDKKNTENQRDDARSALSSYRDSVFPKYEKSINDYLKAFNAAFRIGKVRSHNNRSGSSASYCVVINNEDVDIAAGAGPSFRNTLSAGDRNTLALAFFFASLELDGGLAGKIVVIDDPMTSLDAHRSLKTIQEMRKLCGRVSQLIVLSHSKPFLCALWKGANPNSRSAFRLGRAASGSELIDWNVRDDSITEHDKRHELVSGYIRASDASVERNVAEALRPILEAFMRVAYPAVFPPESLLGPFVGLCRSKQGGGDEILSSSDIDELRDLLDYANKFHHDTNTACETEIINDAELLDFAERTLLFASRR